MQIQKEMGSKALALLNKSLAIETTYLPALLDTAIAYLYLQDFSAVEKALIKVDRQSPGHGAAKKIREAMGRGTAPKGNAARRSMMGQQNNKIKPPPTKSMSPEQRAALARKMATMQGKGGPKSGHKKPFPGDKEYTPDAVNGAQQMMEQMKAQLEHEVQRRKQLGQM